MIFLHSFHQLRLPLINKVLQIVRKKIVTIHNDTLSVLEYIKRLQDARCV